MKKVFDDVIDIINYEMFGVPLNLFFLISLTPLSLSPFSRPAGESVQQVLKIIEVLDGHSFTRCRGHNPLTVLYSKLCTIQSEAEVCTVRFHIPHHIVSPPRQEVRQTVHLVCVPSVHGCCGCVVDGPCAVAAT